MNFVSFVNEFQTLEERFLHTGEVEGSIPSAPTIFAHISWAFSFSLSSLATFQNGTKHEDYASSCGESVEFVLWPFYADIGEMSDQNPAALRWPTMKLAKPDVFR